MSIRDISAFNSGVDSTAPLKSLHHSHAASRNSPATSEGKTAMAARKPHGALQIIRDEHFTLGTVLHSLQQSLRRGPGDAPQQFFDELRAMLFYIDEFPEKRHHPKESDLLFPILARAAPELMPVIERLEMEHMTGHVRVRELQHLLLAWELLGDSHRQRSRTTCWTTFPST